MIAAKVLDKFFYKFTCYFFAFMALLFLSAMLYSKLVFGSVIGYGNMDYNNSSHLSFWKFIWYLYDVALFCFLFAFPLLIIIAFFIKQFKNNMRPLIIGLAGILLLFLLVVADPFNVWEYLSD